jgi:uncharacterized protein (DUF885 family)
MIRSQVTLLLAAALLSGCAAAPTPRTAIVPAEDALTETYFRWFPEIASFYGVPASVAGQGYAARLNPRSPEHEKAKRAEFRELLTRLDAASDASRAEPERATAALLANQLGGALAPADTVEYGAVLSDWGMWFVPYPVTQLSGPQDEVPKLLASQHKVESAQDAEDYLARLDAYGAAVDQVIATIEHDRALGVVPPDFIIERAKASLARLSAADPADNALATGLGEKAREAGLDAPGDWTARAADKVREVVYPANARLAAALDGLRAEAVSVAGIWRLPQGEALYRAMILHMTDTTLEPEAIHQLGLSEVARITTEMDAILRAEGYVEGSVGERVAALGAEPRFLYPNDADGKARLLADINVKLDEIAPLLPKWFGTVPEQTVVVRAVPPEAEGSSTGGTYTAPSLDGSRPGTYWINLRDTSIWPSYELKTLTYHEANPGHHLQVAVGLREDASLMSNVLFSNAFGEGWGLYAEALAHEMGLYANDPYGDLGRLKAELWRAMRLVVDTGLHAKRWTREQAIDYMVKTSGTHPDDARAEVERYVVWPGQALGYKIGMLEIQRLRGEAESALGERFDIRAFHDEVLRDGGAPLQLLEARITRWVESQQ